MPPPRRTSGPPVALAELLFDAPHALAHQAERPRYQISGDTNPDGWGVAWYDAPAHRARVGTAPSPRSGTTAPSRRRAGSITQRRVPRRGSARVAGRDARRHRQRAVRAGPWSFSLNGIVARLPRRRRRRSSARSVEPARRARDRRATPTPRCCSRWCSSTSTAGMPPADALADRRRTTSSPSPPGGSTSCSPTVALVLRHPRRQLPVPTRPGHRVRAPRRRAGLGRGPGSLGHLAHPRRRRRHSALSTASEEPPCEGNSDDHRRHASTSTSNPTPPPARSKPTSAPGSARPRRRCRRSGSTTTAAASCSTRSPGCPSTTPPAPSGRSSSRTRATSPSSPRPTRWSSSARARRRRPASSSTRSRDAGTLERFVPFDVSEQTLRDAAAAIAREYGGVRVHAVVGDFEHHLGELPDGGTRVVAFLGSTIGNLAPAPRAEFLADLAATLAPGRRAPARHRPREGRRPPRRRLRRRRRA